MNAVKPSKALVRQTQPIESKLAGTLEVARRIVRFLLDESTATDALVCEASVHRAKRSRICVASFTGPAGGQVWRSTGLVNRAKALLLAKRWEAEARAQRVAAGRTRAKPPLRAGRSVPAALGPLTQREIALLLNMTERAVRLVERRALQKLFEHPALRQIWRRYLAGELDEHQGNLTAEEIRVLYNLARNAQEWLVLQKVTRLIWR
jgi:hypothetical protein